MDFSSTKFSRLPISLYTFLAHAISCGKESFSLTTHLLPFEPEISLFSWGFEAPASSLTAVHLVAKWWSFSPFSIHLNLQSCTQRSHHAGRRNAGELQDPGVKSCRAPAWGPNGDLQNILLGVTLCCRCETATSPKPGSRLGCGSRRGQWCHIPTGAPSTKSAKDSHCRNTAK